jgi:hypothetical protein
MRVCYIGLYNIYKLCYVNKPVQRSIQRVHCNGSRRQQPKSIISMESQYMPRMTFSPVYWDGDNLPFLFSCATSNLFTQQQQQQISMFFAPLFNVSFDSSIYQNYSSPSSCAIHSAPHSCVFPTISTDLLSWARHRYPFPTQQLRK